MSSLIVGCRSPVEEQRDFKLSMDHVSKKLAKYGCEFEYLGEVDLVNRDHNSQIFVTVCSGNLASTVSQNMTVQQGKTTTQLNTITITIDKNTGEVIK